MPHRVRKNGDLRGIPKVRVIGSSGQMLGVMTLAEALRLAMKESLDLVEVKPAGKPPVCKLLDFSKHTYEAMKKAALGRRKDEPDAPPGS